MDFTTYQQQAMTTSRASADTPTPTAELEIYLLGLAGEVGSVAAEYKKHLRDGDAHARWADRMREELGDVLWYLTAIADNLNLDLDTIATTNLAKTRGRWLIHPVTPLDASSPNTEQLPRTGTYEFRAITHNGRPAVELFFEGTRRGNVLTDAATNEDGYRFHDVFHLAHAAILGWSPVTRKVLDRKRRSDPDLDENEDGGRAIVIEEGIAALVFAYAAQHDYLNNVTRLDQRLLDTITMLTTTTEAKVRTAGDWERAILSGYRCFRQLIAHNGGRIHFDSDTATLTFETP